MNFSENETLQFDLRLAKFRKSPWESENEKFTENSSIPMNKDVVCSWMECCKNVYNDAFTELDRINRTQYPFILNFS